MTSAREGEEADGAVTVIDGPTATRRPRSQMSRHLRRNRYRQSADVRTLLDDAGGLAHLRVIHVERKPRGVSGSAPDGTSRRCHRTRTAGGQEELPLGTLRAGRACQRHKCAGGTSVGRIMAPTLGCLSSLLATSATDCSSRRAAGRLCGEPRIAAWLEHSCRPRRGALPPGAISSAQSRVSAGRRSTDEGGGAPFRPALLLAAEGQRQRSSSFAGATLDCRGSAAVVWEYDIRAAASTSTNSGSDR